MRTLVTAVVVITLGPKALTGQAAPCASAPTAAQDACFTAVDFFQYMTPQLGISFTGGNVILSQGGTLGGLGRFSIGARASAIRGNLLTLQTPSATGPAFRTASNPYPTEDQYIGLAVADAAIGLFRGFNAGFTSVGGVDALVSASYIPTLRTSGLGGDISIEPESPVKFGYGATLGIIEETVFIPGISVSFVLRDLPTTAMLAVIGSDSLQVTDYALKTTSWRLTAGKSFVGLTVAGGVGQDTYSASTTIESIVNRSVIGRVTTGGFSVEQETTRLNYFANVSLNFFVAKLVAEAGVISGGDVTTSNVFDIPADASRSYASLGIRISY